MKLSKSLKMIGVALIVGFMLTPLAVFGLDVLQNSGLEAPFVPFDTYNGWNLQVAEGWEHFWVENDTYKDGARLRFFSASDWAAFNGSPITERVEGDNAQVWWSSSTKKFDAGIYQQVSGLTIGDVYGFQAGILQVFETTSRSDPATGMMTRRVGIDPTGGTDPESDSVLWSPADEHAAFSDDSGKYTWFWPSVGAQAMSDTVTVFVRVRSEGDGSTPNSDQVWADDAFFDIAPTTALSIAPQGSDSVRAAWQIDAVSGYDLYAYEARYRKASESSWTDVQIFNVLNDSPPLGDSATLQLESGIEYVIQARSWHETEVDGRTHQVAGPWAEQPVTLGGVVEGRVLNNRLNPVAGAIVSLTGTPTTTVSGSNGAFDLFTGEGTFGFTAASSAGWDLPQPVFATVPATGTTVITVTVRPDNNLIDNGDFETDLLGWETSPALGSQNLLAEGRHSGDAGLCISTTAMLTYTGKVTEMYRPVLSFWYHAQGGDAQNVLTAEIFGPETFTQTVPITVSGATDGWRYAVLPLALQQAPTFGSGSFGGLIGSFLLPNPEVYSGNLGVRFSVAQNGATPTSFCIDEVSAGRSWGGPNKAYLPLILR